MKLNNVNVLLIDRLAYHTSTCGYACCGYIRGGAAYAANVPSRTSLKSLIIQDYGARSLDLYHL